MVIFGPKSLRLFGTFKKWRGLLSGGRKAGQIGYLRGQIDPSGEILKKGLLAGNGYTGRFWGPTRLIKEDRSSGVYGSSSPDEPVKMAK